MKGVDALCAHIRDTKTPEALQSAFDALAKVFMTGAFNRSERAKLIAAFLRAQASLKVSVIPVSMGGGSQGLMSVLPVDRPIALTAHEKDALLQRIANASLKELERMRQQVLEMLTSSLFPLGDHKSVLQHIDVRLMTLRATG